jgi:hypothetical protein
MILQILRASFQNIVWALSKELEKSDAWEGTTKDGVRLELFAAWMMPPPPHWGLISFTLSHDFSLT